MRVTVTMKCPDALDQAIIKAAEGEIGGPPDSEEHDIMFDDLVAKTKILAMRWFRYGEYVNLTIDTDTETCVVDEV